MNAINYDARMQAIAEKEGNGKRLLLHACCAPCSSACLERLKEYFRTTVLFYNPNIEDEEYFKRKDELVRLINATGWAHIEDCDHDTGEFYDRIKGLENCTEGGERCLKCFELRLEKTAERAAKQGYDYFATTLTLSPLKNAEAINSIGYALAEKHKIAWLPSDFKKRNGYLRSLQLSKQYGLYRQNYCGCVYSMRNT